MFAVFYLGRFADRFLRLSGQKACELAGFTGREAQGHRDVSKIHEHVDPVSQRSLNLNGSAIGQIQVGIQFTPLIVLA
jgi:hypothetical protein